MSRPDLVPLLDCLTEAVPALQAVYLFGSQVADRLAQQSDLDLAVLAGAPLPAELSWRLAADLGRRAGRDVDLVDLRRVDPILGFQVVSRGEPLLVLDTHAQAAWEMTALSRYQDWKITRRAGESALLREVLG